MIQVWYVVFLLLSADGHAATGPQFMSGPYPSQEECVAAGEAIDYPTDAQVRRVVPAPGVYVVSVGCIRTDDDEPPPVDDKPGTST